MEYFTLSNGNKMPMAGIGVFMMSPAEAEEAVESALKSGRARGRQGSTRELEKQIRAAEREVDKAGSRIAEIDGQIAACDASDYVELQRLYEEKSSAEAKLEEMMDVWEELSSRI